MLITPKLSEIQKNGLYLDNFLTNPHTFLVFSGESGSESPEYHKIYMGLVRKFSRYGRFLNFEKDIQSEKTEDTENSDDAEGE